ncbi:MAG: hypothetical protein GY804_00390, partial [Alphaproteobacteria bacterium]|nr:hypothetical protein [Alphaproteobacteria bacterium]
SVSHESNNTSTSSSSTSKPGRKRTSIIWNHCTEKLIDGKVWTICNYCKNQKWILNSSMSTAKSHIENVHHDKLSEEEKIQLRTKNSGKKQQTTSTSKLPVRSSPLVCQVAHHSIKGREWDTQLCQAIISGSLPYNILDNVQFAMFVESISSYTYNLPSRSYMTRTVIPVVYRACKDAIKDRLEHVPHIALTTDAWKSISKQSYITVTSHMIDDEGILHNFLLDTTEIKVRHTSENLHNHIQTVLQNWGMETDDIDITINYNNTNPNDIQAEDIEDGEDFLRELNYYSEDEYEDEDEQVENNTNNIENENTEFNEQLEDDDATQMSRSDVRSVITQPQPPVNVITQPPQAKKKLSFVSDNAADISKALRGNYQWMGCAAHHTNLVIKHGFKNVKSAAKLLNKCKCIVKSINHSNPLIYDVRKFQEELDLPPRKLLQEVTTRWWSILIMLNSI